MQKNIEIFNSNIFVRSALNLSNLKHNDMLCGLEHRFIYILDGEATVNVSNNKITLNKRDILIISAGVPYKIQDSHGKLLFFYFDLTNENNNVTNRIFPCIENHFSNEKLLCKYKLLYNSETFEFLTFKCVYGLSDILLKVCNVNDKTDLVAQKYKSSLLTAAITKAFLNESITNNKNQVGIKVKKFIDENYNKDINIKDASKELSYHESYINRQIKKETGFAFHSYLLNVRLNKALDILNGQGNISIERVSELVGFSDPKYFATCFKRHFKITPSKAKKLF